ncbi:MAG: hypothetical protein ACYTF5_08390, partial [Planctomycetota bacterium]
MKISNHLVAGAVLVLGGLVSAQGTYTTFGQGCPGTGGGTVCASANASTTALPYSQNLNIFALGVPTSTTVKVVMGFELFTQTINQTTPLTINTQIYYTDSTGKPATTPQVTGTMTIGMTPGWYRTTFSKPLIVPANQKFFLSYTSVANRMKAPYGSTGTKVSHFWHSPTATAWNGTPPNGFLSVRWCWKVICAGSNIPALSNSGVPSLGTKFSV